MYYKSVTDSSGRIGNRLAINPGVKIRIDLTIFHGKIQDPDTFWAVVYFNY